MLLKNLSTFTSLKNLFYGTTAPGIAIVINKEKFGKMQGELFLLNASREFVKGGPKNYIVERYIEENRRTEVFISDYCSIYIFILDIRYKQV